MSAPILSAETRERDKIARLSRSLYERGLTAGSSGNISEAARLSGLQRQVPLRRVLDELDGARYQGAHVAKIAGKLSA